MTIEVVSGQKKEIWYVLFHGYGWYETYGPSMTDMASYYPIDKLLQLEKEGNIIQLEKTLPSQIVSFHQLMKLILIEIEKASKEQINDERLKYSINKIPLIKDAIARTK